jgi:hypothetical protein
MLLPSVNSTAEFPTAADAGETATEIPTAADAGETATEIPAAADTGEISYPHSCRRR